MKFCPKCGTELADDAKFCSKCGALQPGFEETEKETAAKKETEKVSKVKASELEGKSEKEKFDYLMEHDEKFKDIYSTSRKTRFFTLINLLFIVPWLVCTVSPIGVFTGTNVASGGAELLASKGYSFPVMFNALSFHSLENLAGNHSLSPNGSVNCIMSTVAFAFGFVFLILITLFGILGNGKGYYVKTYLGPNGDVTLINTLKQPKTWMLGFIAVVYPLISMIVTYFSIDNLNYEKFYANHYGSKCIFGEMTAFSPTLIAGIIVSLFFIILIAVGTTVPTTLFAKRLDKYTKSSLE